MLAFVRRPLSWALLSVLLVPGLVRAQEEEKKQTDKAPAAKAKSGEDLQKEALALNNVRSEDAINKKIKDLSGDRPHARRLVKAAQELLKNKEDRQLQYSGAHILGLAAYEVREYKLAVEYLQVAVEKAEKVKSIKKLYMNRLHLIEAYLADNKPADAEKVADKILTTRVNNELEEDDFRIINFVMFYAQNYLVRCTMMQGNFDKAQKIVDRLEKDFVKNEEQESKPIRAIVLRTKAYFLQYKGDLKDAIKVYEELAEDSEGDDEKERTKELLGNLYADLGQVDKAEELMRPLLKKSPDNASLNNDLGYILAVHGRKLDEAEKMVKKAVEKEPDNSSFLDSMAWVYFKQKKYKEAKEWMLKAMEYERGRNTELMEHLGDIQVALGEKEDAKKSYQKALDAVTPNYKDKQRKPEIEKKLKELGK